jgi:phospholipid/cholesterol/gamma-HCH transport system substrate-binding protein
MNERVMQFRIGMFVIVAGLVLTMLVVWFGESPSLFRDTSYVTAYFPEAPGIAVGIPVRKSGIRVGEVAEIEFDRREGAGDGVLVTLALERKYRIRAGAVPRLARALIGDVSIDLLPGTGAGDLLVSATPAQAKTPERIINGQIAPDPSAALSAVTDTFQKASNTLASIDAAAKGLAKLSASAERVDGFLATWDDTGKKLGSLATNAEGVINENREAIRPAIANIRSVARKVDDTLDPATQQNIRTAAVNLGAASAKLDKVLAQIAPLAADLGAAAGTAPTTNVGQAAMRLNRITFEIGLLTAGLADRSGKRLNPNGTVQKMILQPDLYDNLTRASAAVDQLFAAARPILRNLNTFAERIARDPGAISRGVLNRD